MSQTEFFIGCQPGFSKALLLELQEFWPYLLGGDARPQFSELNVVSEESGGNTLLCEAHIAYQINFFSKIANRVLQRITSFRVRDFPKLHEKLRKLDLKPYFAEKSFSVECHASKSRLNNEKRIAEIANSVWSKRIQEGASHALMIRMHDDLCTISVDTTGRHLHLRQLVGNPKSIGEAPIRETIAAFAIRNLIQDVSLPELSQLTLWDPMAGAGTLISESQSLFIPQFPREFSFQTFPSAAKIFRSEQLALNFPTWEHPFGHYRASDIDAGAIRCLKQNLGKTADIEQLDFTKASICERPTWILTNPPYNKRLEWSAGFKELGAHLARLGSERLSAIIPVQEESHFVTGCRGYQIKQSHSFRNGGLPVVQLILHKME